MPEDNEDRIRKAEAAARLFGGLSSEETEETKTPAGVPVIEEDGIIKEEVSLEDLGLTLSGEEVKSPEVTGNYEDLKAIVEGIKDEMEERESETRIFGAEEDPGKTLVIPDGVSGGERVVPIKDIIDVEGKTVVKAGIYAAENHSDAENKIAEQLRKFDKSLLSKEKLTHLEELVILLTNVNENGRFITRDENDMEITTVGAVNGEFGFLGRYVPEDKLVIVGSIREENLNFFPIAKEVEAIEILKRQNREQIRDSIDKLKASATGDDKKRLEEYQAEPEKTMYMESEGWLETDKTGSRLESLKNKAKEYFEGIREQIEKEVEEGKNEVMGLGNKTLELKLNAKRKYERKVERGGGVGRNEFKDITTEEIFQYILRKHVYRECKLLLDENGNEITDEREISKRIEQHLLIPHNRVALKVDRRELTGVQRDHEARERAANLFTKDILVKDTSTGSISNIVRLLWTGKTVGNRWFKVFEYAEGEEDLKNLTRDEALRYVTLPLIDIIMQLENRGLEHRDIKPGNIICGKEKGLKLLDLGSAKTTGRKGSEVTIRYGTSPITPDYVTQEQIDRESRPPFTDMAQSAKTTHNTLVKERPFPDENNPEKVRAGVDAGKRYFDPTHDKYKKIIYEGCEYDSANPIKLFKIWRERKRIYKRYRKVGGVLGYASARYAEDRYRTLQGYREDVISVLNGEEPVHLNAHLEESGFSLDDFIEKVYETSDIQTTEEGRIIQQKLRDKYNGRLWAGRIGTVGIGFGAELIYRGGKYLWNRFVSKEEKPEQTKSKGDTGKTEVRDSTRQEIERLREESARVYDAKNGKH